MKVSINFGGFSCRRHSLGHRGNVGGRFVWPLILVVLMNSLAVATEKDGSKAASSQPSKGIRSGRTETDSAATELQVTSALPTSEKSEGETEQTGKEGWNSKTSNDAKSTHKQLRVIKPSHDSKPVALLNYCLDKTGQLWMSVSTGSRYSSGSAESADTSKLQKDTNFVQIYDAEGALKAEYPIEFKATAMNFANDGTLILAGGGKVARMSAQGEILKQAPTPNLGDVEEFKKKIIEEAKKERESSAANWTRQIKVLDERLKRIEEKEADESKRSDQDKLMIKQLKMQKEQFEQITESMERSFDIDSLLERRLNVPGVAGTLKEVFIVLAGSNGYEVWRTDYEFGNGKVVAKRLSGCCGNMDVQACNEGFVASINGEFKVVEFDRDGTRRVSFGKRDRNADDGFGSCCNPMNCRILSNGDYIVAESSIGHIKKFNSKGEFIEVVGKAKISGGCKHCSLGYDEQRNRYYMMNEDRNHICVLVPLSEAPEFTEEELQAKEAREGLGRKLIGEWQQEKGDRSKDKGEEKSKRVVDPWRGDTSKPVRMTFADDGSAKVSGGMFENFRGREFSWEPVGQKDGILEFTLYVDGVEFLSEKVAFQSDDNQLELKSKPNYYFNGIKCLVRSK